MMHKFGDNRRAYHKSHPWISFLFDLKRLHAVDWMRLGEVQSKCDHIAVVPLPPDAWGELHRLALVRGVVGSAQIEGNSLSEDQVLAQVEGKLSLPDSQQYLATETRNIIAACNLVGDDLAAGKDLTLTPERIKTFNRMVLADLPPEKDVIPGGIRTKGVVVGNVYAGPPAGDCEFLIDQLCAWLKQLRADAAQESREMRGAIDIIRANLAHLYLAWIHPFGNGNGRTARLAEFQLLLEAGFPTLAAHVLSNYYNKTRAMYYRVLRETSEADGYPAWRFISYSIQGVAEELREQLGLVTERQLGLMWTSIVADAELGATEATRGRRRALLLALPNKGPRDFTPVSAIRKLSPEVAAMYAGKTAKTITRDLNAIEGAGLLVRAENAVRPRLEQLFAFMPLRKHDVNDLSDAEIERSLTAVSEPLGLG